MTYDQHQVSSSQTDHIHPNQPQTAGHFGTSGPVRIHELILYGLFMYIIKKKKKTRTICGETSEKPWREGCRNWWCCLELDVYDPERVVSTDDTEFKGICSRSVVLLAV